MEFISKQIVIKESIEKEKTETFCLVSSNDFFFILELINFCTRVVILLVYVITHGSDKKHWCPALMPSGGVALGGSVTNGLPRLVSVCVLLSPLRYFVKAIKHHSAINV